MKVEQNCLPTFVEISGGGGGGGGEVGHSTLRPGMHDDEDGDFCDFLWSKRRLTFRVYEIMEFTHARSKDQILYVF